MIGLGVVFSNSESTAVMSGRMRKRQRADPHPQLPLGHGWLLVSTISASFNIVTPRARASRATIPNRRAAANMKLTTSFLLPAFIGAASAISDASVYILDASNGQPAANPPTLTPEQARLVFAQRLDASQYHGIGDASESTLSHINKYGGRQGSLFQDVVVDEAAELVLVVEGVSFEKAEPLLKELASTNPAFTISKVPSMAANKKLIEDLQKQSGYSGQNCPLEDAVNPFDTNCWFGKSNVVHFDLLSNKVRRKMIS